MEVLTYIVCILNLFKISEVSPWEQGSLLTLAYDLQLCQLVNSLFEWLETLMSPEISSQCKISFVVYTLQK